MKYCSLTKRHHVPQTLKLKQQLRNYSCILVLFGGVPTKETVFFPRNRHTNSCVTNCRQLQTSIDPIRAHVKAESFRSNISKVSIETCSVLKSERKQTERAQQRINGSRTQQAVLKNTLRFRRFKQQMLREHALSSKMSIILPWFRDSKSRNSPEGLMINPKPLTYLK